jgi:CheY-like chemotaxis protein
VEPCPDLTDSTLGSPHHELATTVLILLWRQLLSVINQILTIVGCLQPCKRGHNRRESASPTRFTASVRTDALQNSPSRQLWALAMGHPQTVSRSRILLVQSNAIIGLDLADELDGCGYEVAGPFACDTALEWLETDAPDLAVLDGDLRSGLCVDLARALRAHGVPILIFSSYDQKDALPEFSHLLWLSMPAPVEALHIALGVLSLRRGRIILPSGGPTSGPRAVGSREPRVGSLRPNERAPLRLPHRSK